ncbi:flavin reductase [Pseudactinotalea sp. HY158]|nr:flavin reductase [Pseudactinotalea sp. HY158]
MTMDGEEYRALMSRLVSGVSVVALRDGHHDLAMTATSVVSVALEPPTVLFAVHADARLAERIETGAEWAVSILGPTGGSDAEWLASPGRPTIGQLDRVPHRRGELTGAAVLESASAWLEARTVWTKEAASHLVVVGEVLSGGVRPGVAGATVHAFGRLETFPAS